MNTVYVLLYISMSSAMQRDLSKASITKTVHYLHRTWCTRSYSLVSYNFGAYISCENRMEEKNYSKYNIGRLTYIRFINHWAKFCTIFFLYCICKFVETKLFALLFPLPMLQHCTFIIFLPRRTLPKQSIIDYELSDTSHLLARGLSYKPSN